VIYHKLLGTAIRADQGALNGRTSTPAHLEIDARFTPALSYRVEGQRLYWTSFVPACPR
jgi:hypothetical protein